MYKYPKRACYFPNGLPLRGRFAYSPRHMDTQRFYANMYSQTSYASGIGKTRTEQLSHTAKAFFQKYDIGPKAVVLEIGAGHGNLRNVHPNWHGVEYSEVAIKQGLKAHGKTLRLKQGDATKLAWKNASVDALYTFATLEHVPQIEKAFREIKRILKPGGVALLAPAWNCRPWTVQKLQQRPYSELTLKEKLGKLLIPFREFILFRLLCSLPNRFWREYLLFSGYKIGLAYKPLTPRWDLMEKYPHIADDDAFISMDAHAAIAYFLSRGWKVPSHNGFFKRLFCRGEPIVVMKPSR